MSELSEFLAGAAALRDVRDNRLFLATHTTFEAYVAERWGLVSAEVTELLDRAAKIESVRTFG